VALARRPPGQVHLDALDGFVVDLDCTRQQSDSHGVGFKPSVGTLNAARHGNSVLSNCAGQRNAVKENAAVCDVDFVRLAVGIGVRDPYTADAIDRHRHRRVDTPVTANVPPHCAVGIPSRSLAGGGRHPGVGYAVGTQQSSSRLAVTNTPNALTCGFLALPTQLTSTNVLVVVRALLRRVSQLTR
jgi:hypothetical protein